MASLSDVLDRLLHFMQNQSAPRRTAEDADVSDRTQRRVHETEFEADVARRRLDEAQDRYDKQAAAGVVTPEAEEALRRAELQADRAEAEARQARANADRAEQAARRRDIGNAPSFGLRTLRGAVEGINAGFADPQGLVRRGEEEGSRYKAAAGHAFAAMQTSGLGGISSSLRAGGELAGYLPLVGGVAENFIKLGAALTDTLQSIRRWGDTLHAANMRFAQFSPEMAGVAARDFQRQMLREMTRGSRRAESAERLSQARDRLETAVNPWEDQFDVFMNNFGSLVLEYLGEDGLLGKLNELARKFGLLGDPKPKFLAHEDLEAAAKEAAEASRPPRLR